MRAKGFSVTNLELGFDRQYLLADGRLEGSEPQVWEGEESIDELQAEVVSFGKDAERAIRDWRLSIQQTHNEGGRVVLWGGGSKAVAFMSAVGLTEEIEFVVDINPFKQGMYLPGAGQEVVAPAFLQEYRPTRVIIMNPIYQAEIARDLHVMDLSPLIESVQLS